MPGPVSLLDLLYQRDLRDPHNAPPDLMPPTPPGSTGPPGYYRGNMPEYQRPNQDRNAMWPDELQQYWWAKRHGIPQERP